jgi:hypothetical protein
MHTGEHPMPDPTAERQLHIQDPLPTLARTVRIGLAALSLAGCIGIAIIVPSTAHWVSIVPMGDPGLGALIVLPMFLFQCFIGLAIFVLACGYATAACFKSVLCVWPLLVSIAILQIAFCVLGLMLSYAIGAYGRGDDPTWIHPIGWKLLPIYLILTLCAAWMLRLFLRIPKILRAHGSTHPEYA